MTKKNRPKRELQNDPGVIERQTIAINKFDKAFRINMPKHEASGQQNPHSSGSYIQAEGDKFEGEDYPIADGRYRVEGADWIHTFEGGGYVQSELARPPNFGGSDVIAVAPLQPGAPGND